jgi:hypothetical protein
MDADYARHAEIAPAQPLVSEAPAPTTPERPRGEDGKFLKTPPTPEEVDRAVFEKHRAKMAASLAPDVLTEQPKEAKGEQPDAPAEQEESKAEAVDKDALAAALQNAKRLKIPKSALDALAPKDLVQANEAWSKQLRASDDLSRELGELRKQIEETKAKPKESAQAEQPDDYDALVQPFVADYDDGTRNSLKGIAKVARDYADAQTKTLKGELDALRGELQSLKQARGAEVAESIRGELRESFPQLGEGEVWNAVLKRAETLLRIPDYQGNPREALEHACKIECASSQPAKQVSDSTDRSKRNGVASTTTQAARKAPLNGEAHERAVFDRLMARQSGVL